MLNGILVVNKPKGITSHDVVDIVRNKLGMHRIGHAGTLDPEATGVLVVLVGNATKLFDKFLSFEKEYLATLTLGIKTSSGDAAGQILEKKSWQHITRQMVEEVIPKYIGEIFQIPPMVSAIKYKGQRLYKLARKGKDVQRAARRVLVKELRLLEFSPPNLGLYIKCSRGTYVRKLAEDIAQDLGTVGFVSHIQRTKVGPFSLESAVNVNDIDTSKVKPLNTIDQLLSSS
ncbi:MAG: tRNA pseudouridine(55) synthase TruB [Candidatus Omnitrophica bacterium]|nr:tRNA pseudouridine(55) synthase TruB [Candidatus Omnitrophota bacterium]